MRMVKRFRLWSLDNKLQFWGIVLAALGVVGGSVIVPIMFSGGGNSARIGTNTGQVNVGGTVNNYVTQENDPNPNGPHVQSNSCPQVPGASQSSSTTSIDLLVRPYENGECWARATTVGLTPSTIEFEIAYTNTSKMLQKDVVLGVKLANGLTIVPGTTYLASDSSPNGQHLDTDAIDTSGVVIGSYDPGANAFLAFRAETPSVGDLHCGSNRLRTIATVQPRGLNYFYNTADIDLTKTCASPSGSG